MTDSNKTSRRTFLQTSLAASAGISAVSKVQAESAVDATDSKNGVPYGTIGDVKVSRMLLGSNFMGGEAHSRDLTYVRQLMKNYNTEERVYNSMRIAEAQGINTVVVWSPKKVIQYNKECGGNMQWISTLRVNHDYTDDQIRKQFDNNLKSGTRLIYVWGCSGDLLTRDKRIDMLGRALDIAKEMGITCGIGGHSSQVIVECEKQKLKPAFYVKTFHQDNYWSATPRENRKDYCWYPPGGDAYLYAGPELDHNDYHDNMWCLDPEKTADIMKKVTVPWIAFKVLAAGAISPTSAFKYTFQNGADFMAVGMMDYQVEEDVNIVKGLFARGVKRDRPWHG
jgi:hypothetical protein